MPSHWAALWLTRLSLPQTWWCRDCLTALRAHESRFGGLVTVLYFINHLTKSRLIPLWGTKHYTTTRMVNIKTNRQKKPKLLISKHWHGFENPNPHTVGGSIHLSTIFKNHLLISLKFKTGIPYDLGISVLSVSLKDKHAYVHKRNAHSSNTDKAKI